MKLLYLILVCASALKLKEQPSGFFNFSRINNITLPSKSSIDSPIYHCPIFSKSNNFVMIISLIFLSIPLITNLFFGRLV